MWPEDKHSFSRRLESTALGGQQVFDSYCFELVTFSLCNVLFPLWGLDFLA